MTWKPRLGGMLVVAAVGMIESNLETGLMLPGGLIPVVSLISVIGLMVVVKLIQVARLIPVTRLLLVGGLIRAGRLMSVVVHRLGMKPAGLGQIFGCSRRRVLPGR